MSGPFYSWGVGAGAGGISESKLKLNKNEEIEITLSEGVTSFGNYLSATVGETPSKYQSDSSGNNIPVAGIGGNGNGGNVGNYKGGDGSTDGESGRNGSTNSNAKYGNAIGSLVSHITMPSVTILRGGFYPFGAGRGITSLNNGAFRYAEDTWVYS